MKFTTVTFVTLTLASSGAQASLRRSLKVQETAANPFSSAALQPPRSLSVELGRNGHEDANPVSFHQPSITPQERSLVSATSTCTTTDYRCTQSNSCVCNGEFNIKENLIPSVGCYHCSKPDGASCTTSGDCMWGVSQCIDNVCAPQQCPNDATVGVNADGYTVTTSTCTTQSCSCTVGEYTVKQSLGNGCFHCAKPDGAMCVDDHECVSGSDCVDGFCGTPQCQNTATVQPGGSITSYCTRSDCACSGEYDIKEDITGNGCYHCAKSRGASCTEDHECSSDSACNDGVCGAIQCPNTSVGYVGYCSRQECECSLGDYTVMQDLTGDGCNHCSKPNGASCVADDECLSPDGNIGSRCIGGICAVPVNYCPRYANWQCTRDETCVCDATETRHESTLSDGDTCYSCRA